MANKINVKLILELRASGTSRNAIASIRHISPYSVIEVFHIADEKGVIGVRIKIVQDKMSNSLKP